MSKILKTLAERESNFMSRYGRPAETVIMNPATWAEISANCTCTEIVVGAQGIYIMGMKVIRSSDVAPGTFYFSPQV